MTASNIDSIGIDIIVIFRLFGKIPQIPEREMIIGNVEYLTRSISVGNVERRGRKFRRGLDSKFSFVWVGSAESSSKLLGWVGWIISKKEKKRSGGRSAFHFMILPLGEVEYVSTVIDWERR